MLIKSSENRLATWAILFHLIGLVIAVLAIGVFYWLVISPINQQHAVVSGKVTQLKNTFQMENAVRAEHTRLSDALSSADENVDRLLNRIPTVPQEAAFLGQITTLAREVGLEIVDYRPSGTSSREEYQEMTVALSSEGSYPGILTFLRRVHHLPRLSKVNNLKIVPRPNGEAYSLDMTLAIYFAPKNKLSAATEVTDG